MARYLAGMGQGSACIAAPIPYPHLRNWTPKAATSFTMALQTAVGRDEIEGAFSFVADDCEYDVVAPETQGQKLARAIEAMPDRHAWVRCWCRWARSRLTSWNRC